MSTPLPQRVPENAPGDFYVQADCCTSCCLVHEDAPDLLNDPAEPFRECYFRRQPQTPEEIDRAINAICVSEMAALRYGGTDPVIIAKMRERGVADQCDHTPEGRASLEESARYAAAAAERKSAAPDPLQVLNYFGLLDDRTSPRGIRIARRAKSITGWLTLVSLLWAFANAGDRNPLRESAYVIFTCCLLAYALAVLTDAAVRVSAAARERSRRR
jgi:hypothetical protein